MEDQPIIKTHSRLILVSAILVVFVSLALVVGAVKAESSQSTVQSVITIPVHRQLHLQGDKPQDCAECHPDVEHAWLESSHAHAYDDEEFSTRWNSLGKPGECLACHTTNYQSSTNSFTAEGVQCEACHGQMTEGHPPAVMPVKADTEYCGACHTTTLGEWRLTGHSTAGVGCMDCHDPHSQDALFEDPDEMCLNCHRDEMGDYLEDMHIQKGIGCVDCHALVIPPDPMPEDGVVPTGHSFTITTSTCVACHTDALHAGFSLPGYENGAKAATADQPETGETQPVEVAEVQETHTVESLTAEQQIQALEASLASSRFSSLFQGGLVGLVLGGLTIYYAGRNLRRKPSDESNDGDADQPSPADADAVDQELEKVLAFVERSLDWITNTFKKVGGWFTRKKS
jgi:predicted CXXCH cytochrome family protein